MYYNLIFLFAFCKALFWVIAKPKTAITLRNPHHLAQNHYHHYTNKSEQVFLHLFYSWINSLARL